MTHPGAKIYCMAGAGSLLFTGSADRSIRAWDTRAGNGAPVAVLQGHTRSVWSLKVPPPSFGEHSLLSAGNCGNVNVWDLRTWKARLTMNFENNEALSVDCSPDGRTVFAGSSTSKIYAFDAASGEMRARLSGHQWEVWQLEAVALAAGCAPLLASGSYDHTVGLWALEGPFPLRKTLAGHKARLWGSFVLLFSDILCRAPCIRCAASAAASFPARATRACASGARANESDNCRAFRVTRPVGGNAQEPVIE